MDHIGIDVHKDAELLEHWPGRVGMLCGGSEDGVVMSDPGPSVQRFQVLSGLLCISFSQKDPQPEVEGETEGGEHDGD